MGNISHEERIKRAINYIGSVIASHGMKGAEVTWTVKFTDDWKPVKRSKTKKKGSSDDDDWRPSWDKD
jgi:hypothetical protein